MVSIPQITYPTCCIYRVLYAKRVGITWAAAFCGSIDIEQAVDQLRSLVCHLQVYTIGYSVYV